MNKTIKILGLLLVIALAVTCLFACKKCDHIYDAKGVCTICGEKKCDVTGKHSWYNGKCIYDDVEKSGFVDYVDQLDFDAASGRAYFQDVTVKNYVDGDTTHFRAPVDATGVLKARYLAVNTPESTGTVEPYGKVASNFTKEKLKNAESIILESDNSNWNKDSTSTRYTVWVWYKPAGGQKYRNLNLELLQEGLAIASNSEGNSYGDICGKALRQAQEFGYRVHNEDVQDELFYYGEAISLTLKELRSDIENYARKTVAFEGIVSYNYNNGVYVEEYDEDTGLSFGVYCYYGFTKNTRLIKNLSVGNRVRVVGTVGEFNGTYQISNMDYLALEPDDPNNTIRIGTETYEAPWVAKTVEEFYANHTVIIPGDDDHAEQEVTDKYAALAQGTTISMTNLVIDSIYTTTNLDSSSRGAMSFTCTQAGTNKTIVIRTTVLKDTNGMFNVPDEHIAKANDSVNNPNNLPAGVVLASYFMGKTINITGVVGYYDSGNNEQYGTSPYQIQVFSLAQIEFVS